MENTPQPAAPRNKGGRPRKTREASTRESTSRTVSEFETLSMYHIPAGTIPPDEHWYWATMSVRGEPATAHMAELSMAGYTTVPADKYPQITGASLLPTQNPHNIVTRGPSLLVSIPKRKYEQILKRRVAKNRMQLEAVKEGIEGSVPIIVEANQVKRENVTTQIKA